MVRSPRAPIKRPHLNKILSRFPGKERITLLLPVQSYYRRAIQEIQCPPERRVGSRGNRDHLRRTPPKRCIRKYTIYVVLCKARTEVRWVILHEVASQLIEGKTVGATGEDAAREFAIRCFMDDGPITIFQAMFNAFHGCTRALANTLRCARISRMRICIGSDE